MPGRTGPHEPTQEEIRRCIEEIARDCGFDSVAHLRFIVSFYRSKYEEGAGG